MYLMKFKSPLASIQGFSQTLNRTEELTKEQRNQYLSIIEKRKQAHVVVKQTAAHACFVG